MKIRPTSIFILYIVLLHICDGYRILGVFPHRGKSHFYIFLPIMKELARRGHDVTVMSQFPEKNPLPNYTDINLLNSDEVDENHGIEVINASMFHYSSFHDFRDVYDLGWLGTSDCELLGLPKIQKFIKSKPKFDVIIQEFFDSDCFLALNYIFQAPLIGVSSCSLMAWHHRRLGVPLTPAYVPNNLSEYSDKMNFFQRVYNTITSYLFSNVLVEPLMRKPNNEVARKHLGDGIPELEEIAKNTTVMFLNTHYTMNQPRPWPPGVVEIGGVHLPEKVKKLPDDLEKFISESAHGVIYFCLGSLVRGDTFPESERNKFLEVFSQLPQRVLWKYENETLPGKPDNVMIRKWMPQFDILNHPNVKVFISHGGLLGSIEAISSGTPIISMPFFGDQFTNARSIERHGSLTVLESHTLTKEKIANAIKFALKPETMENAKKLSRVFRDRPISALNSAVWWVEYVARNGHHLTNVIRPSVVDMPFYQAELYDVYLFLLVSLILVIYVFYIFVQKIVKSRSKLKKD